MERKNEENRIWAVKASKVITNEGVNQDVLPQSCSAKDRRVYKKLHEQAFIIVQSVDINFEHSL